MKVALGLIMRHSLKVVRVIIAFRLLQLITWILPDELILMDGCLSLGKSIEKYLDELIE